MSEEQIIKEIKMYDADTLEYAGSIQVYGKMWSFAGIDNSDLTRLTRGMPLKGVLMSLISFNLVYDIIYEEE